MKSFLTLKNIAPLLAGILPLASAAQDAASGAGIASGDSSQLEEVVVTAEKRSTNLQQTPIAVSVVGVDSLRDNRQQLLRDLAGDVPSLVTPSFHRSMQQVYIRGVGTADPGSYQAVGIYVDDVFVPRQFGNGLTDLLDLERVEILRGPQGTLYGQNTSGGAIKYITRDPQNELAGKFDVGTGNFSALEVHGYLTGPLIDDRLSASLAYTHRGRGGYTADPTLGRDLDRLDTDQARAKFKLTATENLDFVLSADYSIDRSDNAVYTSLLYPGSSPRVSFANRDTRLDRKAGGASLRGDLRFGDTVTLRSITAYRILKDDPSPWDQDGTPAEIYGWNQYIDHNQFSQEFQAFADLGRLQLTGGVSYFDEQFDFDRVTVVNQRYTEIDSGLNAKSYGVYGQGTYHVTQALSLTAGLRYNIDEQDSRNASYNTTADEVRTSQIYAVTGLSSRWKKATPKFAVDYEWNPRLMTYVSWTEGQKAGGYNRSAATAAIASIPVQPETVQATELGAKARWFDNRLQTNLAVFYNDFSDYQSSITNPIVNGQRVTGSVLVNAASATTYGSELETIVRLGARTEIKASAAYLHTKFDEFANPTGAATTDFTGNELPQSPHWNFSLSGNSSLQLAHFGALQLRGRVRYKGDNFTDVGNTTVLAIPATTLVDLGASYVPASGPWVGTLSVTNLFDKTYYVVGNRDLVRGWWTAGYNEPRFVNVAVRYDF